LSWRRAKKGSIILPKGKRGAEEKAERGGGAPVSKLGKTEVRTWGI